MIPPRTVHDASECQGRDGFVLFCWVINFWLSFLVFLVFLPPGHTQARDAKQLMEEAIGSLRNGSKEKRVKAAQDLANIRPVTLTIIDALVTSLRDPEPDVVEEASKALAIIGAPALKRLIDVIKADDARQCIGACRALQEMGVGSRVAIPKLINLLKAHDPRIRVAAIIALRGTKDESTIDPVIELLTGEKNIYVAHEAVRNLVFFAKSKKALAALPLLIDLTLHPPRLGLIKGKYRFAEDYGLRFQSDMIDLYFQENVRRAASRLGTRAIPQLEAMIQKKTGGLKSARGAAVVFLDAVIQELRWSGINDEYPRAIGSLTKLLDDPDPLFKKIAVRCLERLGSDAAQALSKLNELATNPNEREDVRQAASAAIRRITKEE